MKHIYYIIQINGDIEVDADSAEKGENEQQPNVQFDIDPIHILSGTYEVSSLRYPTILV